MKEELGKTRIIIPITEAKIEALSMFLQGVTEKEISKQLRKNKNTITAWKKKYNWENHAQKLEEETRKKTFESNEDRKNRLLKICVAVQMAFVKALQEGNVKISAMDAIRAMEAETRLCGLDIQKMEISEEGPVDWIAALKRTEEEDALVKEESS